MNCFRNLWLNSEDVQKMLLPWNLETLLRVIDINFTAVVHRFYVLFGANHFFIISQLFLSIILSGLDKK